MHKLVPYTWIGFVLALLVSACDSPRRVCDPNDPSSALCPVVTRAVLEAQPYAFEEVLKCRISHDHELRYVRAVADPLSAARYRECVTSESPCDGAFPPGSLFIKYEYNEEGCHENSLLGFTAALKLQPDALPEGFDWRWQRLSSAFEVLEDGAPERCVSCHTFHCSAPTGYDLRCLPD